MLEVVGTAASSMQWFLIETYGQEVFDRWLKSLSEDAQQIYGAKIIFPGRWFPAKTIIVEPTQKVCDMFYNRGLKGAWDAGRFSADNGLNVIKKMLMNMRTPHMLIERSGTLLPSYYRPSRIEVIDQQDNSAIMEITEFPELCPIIENRIGGWMERALEINGCTNVSVVIENAFSHGEEKTRVKVAWEKNPLL
jgi:hypothetical protein